jgi:Arc/MetJ family transcription regulator
MRTNIELNDALVKQAQKLSGLKTKKAVVEEGLRILIRMYRQRNVRKLRGKLEWDDDLNELRKARVAGTR